MVKFTMRVILITLLWGFVQHSIADEAAIARCEAKNVGKKYQLDCPRYIKEKNSRRPVQYMGSNEYLKDGWHSPLKVEELKTLQVFPNKMETNEVYDYDSQHYIEAWKFSRTHNATDIVADVDTKVYSIDDGVVEFIERDERNKYNVSRIYVKHRDNRNNEFLAVYGHVYAINSLSVGDTVKGGELIGLITPYGSPPHLHLAILDPIPSEVGNYWFLKSRFSNDPESYFQNRKNVQTEPTRAKITSVNPTETDANEYQTFRIWGENFPETMVAYINGASNCGNSRRLSSKVFSLRCAHGRAEKLWVSAYEKPGGKLLENGRGVFSVEFKATASSAAPYILRKPKIRGNANGAVLRVFFSENMQGSYQTTGSYAPINTFWQNPKTLVIELSNYAPGGTITFVKDNFITTDGVKMVEDYVFTFPDN